MLCHATLPGKAKSEKSKLKKLIPLNASSVFNNAFPRLATGTLVESLTATRRIAGRELAAFVATTVGIRVDGIGAIGADGLIGCDRR